MSMTLATELRRYCGHDSRSVDGCVHCEAADALENAHLARQSEVVSDEDVFIASRAYTDFDGDIYSSMRAALTAVWHNRPAQEKAEPVATVASVRAELVKKIGDCCQGGDPLCAGGCLAEIAAKRNAERTFPPAERVRVPDGWYECISQAAAALDVLGRRDLSAWLMRVHKAMLSAAPEADHE